MSASLGMETMHKNALTLEKENMKSSIPSPACTNQVKQYTQEVKTSKFVFRFVMFSFLKTMLF